MKRFTSAAPVRGFCDQRGTLGDTSWAVVITYSAILGRVIRTQRELRKVDLSDMSKRLGFASVSSYSRLETGDVPITVNALSAIARALASHVSRLGQVVLGHGLQRSILAFVAGRLVH